MQLNQHRLGVEKTDAESHVSAALDTPYCADVSVPFSGVKKSGEALSEADRLVPIHECLRGLGS
jgi:hypothetical protein